MSRPPNQFKRVFLPVVLLFVLTMLLARMALDKSFDQGLRTMGRETKDFLDPQFLEQWWRVGRVMELAHLDYLQSEKVTYSQLANTALDHVLDGLDRYSDYLTPEKYENFLRESDQRYIGVGVEMERRNGHLQITQVAPDSPAFSAGWLPGDRLVKVAGKNVSDFSVAELSKLLQGADGSTVQVTRMRAGVAINGSLTRHSFDVPSVRGLDDQMDPKAMQLRPDGIGYLRITQFGKHTGQEFSTALHELMAKGMRGLVLDLRDNGGGLLESSIDVLEPLLPANQTVATTTNGHDVVKTLATTGAGNVHYQRPRPIVVLMNDSSASAAEIVAGALQDTHRAVIVGEQSYGKGVVQSVIPLADGGGLRLTTDNYKLPSGRSIEGTGITPDILIPQTAETHHLEHLQDSDLLQFKSVNESAEKFTTAFGFAPVIDPQMETAVGLIRALSPGFTP